MSRKVSGLEPRIIAACMIVGVSLLLLVAYLLHTVPRRRREKLRRRGIKTHKRERPARTFDTTGRKRSY